MTRLTWIGLLVIMTTVYTPTRSVIGYRLEPSYRHAPRRFVGVYQSDYYCGGNHAHVLDGDYLYVSGWSANGWLALDVSDPYNMRKVGWVEDSEHIDRATHLSIGGHGIGYCTSERADSLVAIDIGDPTNMMTVGFYQNHGIMNTPVASVCDENNNWVFVIARGEYESPPGSTERTTGDALLAFDIDNPETPVLRSYIQDHTYLRGPRDLIWNEDTYEVVCACLFGGMISGFDVSAPETGVTRTFSVDLTGISLYPHSICKISGSTNVAVVGGTTLAVVNVEETPGIVGYITDATHMNAAYSVAVKGGYAYVANRYRDSVAVYDISTPASPSYVTELVDSDNLEDAYYITTDLYRDYVYVSSYTSNTQVILDVSDPSDISIAGPKKIRPMTVITDELESKKTSHESRRITSMSRPGPSAVRTGQHISSGKEEMEFRPVEQWEWIQTALQAEAQNTAISLTSATITATRIYDYNGNFIANGIVVGQWVRLQGAAVDAANTDPVLVTAVTSNTITVDATLTPQSGIVCSLTRNHVQDGNCDKLSIELERFYGDSGDYMWFPGQIIKRWDFVLGTRAGAIQSTFTLEGAGAYPLATSQGLTWYDWTAEEVVGSKHVLDLEFNGSSLLGQFSGFSLFVENKLEWVWEHEDERPVGFRRSGEMRVGGTVSAYHDGYASIASILAGPSGSLRLTAQNGNFFALNLPNVTARLTGGPEGSGRGDFRTYRWDLTTDSSGGYMIGMDLFEGVEL